MDQREAAIDAGAIVPGKPDDSEALRRIFSTDADEVMPPPEQQKQLTAEQKELLKRWVAAGAEYQPHWSFIAPMRPPLPAVKNAAWVRNPIDAFILAKLEEHGLEPAPEADRRTLARRLSLDLTGLPPAPGDVEAFVDDASPDAYETIRRPAAAIRALGRAPRPLLAGRRPLRRHARHPLRQLPRDLGLSRLGDRRLQPQPAVRPVHDRAAGRRPAAERHARPADRHRLPPLQHHHQRRRRDPEEYLVLYARDRTETTSRVWLGLDRELRDVPRPQVRPAHAARVLRDGGVLQQHDASRDGRQHQGHAAGASSSPLPEDRARWEAIGPEIAAAKQQVDDRRKHGPRRTSTAGLPRPSPPSWPSAVPADGLQVPRAAERRRGRPRGRDDRRPSEIAAAGRRRRVRSRTRRRDALTRPRPA